LALFASPNLGSLEQRPSANAGNIPAASYHGVMELHEICDRVNSKETFLQFVEALLADWHASRKEERANPSSPYSAAARGWENIEIGAFLEAMSAWSQDMGDRLESQPSWQTFANMLMAGKIYE
jgi:hypothetical protein